MYGYHSNDIGKMALITLKYTALASVERATTVRVFLQDLMSRKKLHI